MHGNPSLARHLLTTFAHAAPNSVLALPSPNDRLPDDVSIVYEALFGRSGARVDVVLVGVPMPSSNKDKAKAWDAEEIYDVGSALLRTRREEDDVVIIAVGGDLRPGKNVSSLAGCALSVALADASDASSCSPRRLSLHYCMTSSRTTLHTRGSRLCHRFTQARPAQNQRVGFGGRTLDSTLRSELLAKARAKHWMATRAKCGVSDIYR